MNNKKENSVLLIGGNLVCGTIYKRGLLSAINVTDTLIGASPFALASSKKPIFKSKHKDPVRRVDLNNGLSDYLENADAEYVIVDLHYVCQPLVTRKASYYTKYADMPLTEYGKGAKEVSANDLSRDKKQHLTEEFAKIILKHFPSDKIALVKTYKSAYYAVGDRIREQECATFNKTMSECEDLFVKKTGCTVIDTLRFYYMEKKPNGNQYESEAYADTADNIRRFVRRQHVRRRPIFRYSLDRCCKYYSNLYKKAFGSFLRSSWAVENLVYSAEPWFIKENYELLRSAEKLLKSSYTEVADGLDMSAPNAETAREILLAMNAVIAKDYVNPSIRYDQLFKNKLTVRALWKDTVDYARAHWSDVFPEQVTEVNYGYYFARMQLEMTDDEVVRYRAEDILRLYDGTPETILKPHAVDLLGSCVSRLTFQYCLVDRASSIVVRTDMFQALPVFMDGPKPFYLDMLFSPPISNDNLVIKHQLDGTVCDTLNKSGADWLVLDFYTLTALSIYNLRGKYYNDNKNFCSKRLGAKNVNLYEAFSDDEIKAELDRLAEYVRGRYGDRVILIKHKRMTHYIDFCGKLKRFGDKDYNDSITRNPKSDIYAEHFAKCSGCYYIDFVDSFVSDEMNLLYLNSVHYENEFYYEVIELMHKIIEEMPSARHYSEYRSSTRVSRMAKLRQNNSADEIPAELFPTRLDRCVLKLPAETITANAAAIAELYDKGLANDENAESLLSSLLSL